MSYYADAGTGSLNFTWQAFAGIGYRFKHFDALVGWRHLAYRFDGDRPVSDLTLSGPRVRGRVQLLRDGPMESGMVIRPLL